MLNFNQYAFRKGVRDVLGFVHLRRMIRKVARRMMFKEPDCSLRSELHQALLADYIARRGHAPKGMAK